MILERLRTGVKMNKNSEYCLPTFVLKNGLLPTFSGFYGYSAHFLFSENREKRRKSGHLPGFCPLLKTKSGQKKVSIHAGLRAFCPLSHFFS